MRDRMQHASPETMNERASCSLFLEEKRKVDGRTYTTRRSLAVDVIPSKTCSTAASNFLPALLPFPSLVHLFFS